MFGYVSRYDEYRNSRGPMTYKVFNPYEPIWKKLSKESYFNLARSTQKWKNLSVISKYFLKRSFK